MFTAERRRKVMQHPLDFDLARVVFRRRRLAAGVFAAVLAAGALVSWLLPLKFESRAIVYIGHVRLGESDSVEVLLEQPEVLQQRLRLQYGRRQNRREPFLQDVAIDSRANRIVTLEAVADTSQNVQRFLQELVDQLLKTHQQSFDAALSPARQEIGAIDTQITALRRELAMLGEHRRESVDSSTALRAFGRGMILRDEIVLSGRRARLEASILQPLSQMTRIVGPPSAPGARKTSGPAVVVGLASIVGALLAVILAVVVEALQSRGVREENKKL